MSAVETVTDEAIALCNIFIADIKRMLGTDNAQLVAMNIQEKQILTGIFAKLMRGVTGMIKEKRGLLKDAKEAAEQMSYDDKRNLIVQFIEMMPPEHKAELRAQLGWLAHG